MEPDTDKRVSQAEGYFDEYFVEKDYRLKQIRYGQKKKKLLKAKKRYVTLENLDLIEKFFWNESGELVLSALCDGNEKNLRVKSYRYDERGNVLEERIYGDFKGEGAVLPSLDQEGKFISIPKESYRVFYEYSSDGLNLILK